MLPALQIRRSILFAAARTCWIAASRLFWLVTSNSKVSTPSFFKSSRACSLRKRSCSLSYFASEDQFVSCELEAVDNSCKWYYSTHFLADAKTLQHFAPRLSRLRANSWQRAWPNPEEQPVTNTTCAIYAAKKSALYFQLCRRYWQRPDNVWKHKLSWGR